MKKIEFFSSLILIIVILNSINCSKEPLRHHTTKLPPVVSAGKDITVFLPANFAMLSGNVDTYTKIKSYNWEKISGPSSFTIENKQSLSTNVTDLITGEYAFELTVVDENGLYDNDTIIVWVEDISAFQHQLLFEENPWDCFWDCAVTIEAIDSFLPSGSLFKILLSVSGSKNWEVVSLNRNYIYELYGNDLFIFPNNEYFNPDFSVDIKIVY